MSLRCPDCSEPVHRWRAFWLLRLHAFHCGECNCPMTLDRRGRTTLMGSVLAALVAAIILYKLTASPLVAFATVGAGYLLGCVAVWRVGDLVIHRRK